MPPTDKEPPNDLFNVGIAASTATQAPVVLAPLVALLAMFAVIFVAVPILALPFVLLAAGHVLTVGAAAVETFTVIVHDVAGLVIAQLVTVKMLAPGLAVVVPTVHVPPTAGVGASTNPAGSVSVKLKACVGLPVGCVTVKVRVDAPPTVRSPEKALLTCGVAAVTVTQAPVVLVPPPAALLLTLAVMFVVALMLLVPFVLLACGQVPTVGAAAFATRTVMVQEVAGLTICRLVTVIVPLPAVAATLPPLQVPPTVEGEATTKPAGKVSAKLNVCVGLPLGWLTVKVRVCVPPTVNAPANVLLTVGTA